MHSESSTSLSNEIAAYRRSLLCLPVVFRYPESIQFARRTDERDFWLHENVAANGETFATGVRRSGLGRRRAAETGGAAASVQGDAQRDAQAHDPAAGVYPETHTSAGFSKHFPSRHRG